MQRTGSKKRILLSIALTFVLAVASMFTLLPLHRTDAATIRTSSLYTSADSVKYKGTESGTEISLTNNSAGTVSFKNKLHTVNLDIQFKILSDNFDRLVFSFFSTNPEETKATQIENKVEFSATEGSDKVNKLSIRFIDGDLTPTEQSATPAVNTDINFLNAEISLQFKGDYFLAKIGDTEYTHKVDGNIVKIDPIYYNEADLKIAFEDVEAKSTETNADDVVAKILLVSINGQSLAEKNSTLTDTVEPEIVVDYGAYRLISGTSIIDIVEQKIESVDMTESNMFLAGANANIDVPVRLYDVLQTSLDATLKYTLIKDKDGNAIATEDQKTDTRTGLNCLLKEEGIYKIEVSAPKSSDSDSETVSRIVYVKTIADDQAPIIDSWYVSTLEYASAGSAYNVKRPQITDANQIDTKFNVSYKLWYKAQTASDWTSVSGLSFTPSAEGVYMIKLQATDKSGNISNVSSDIQKIEFRDTDAPKLTISNFPKTAYIDEELTIPTGSVSDTVDSSPTKSYKLYFLGTDGTETASDENEITKIKNNTFKPDKLGTYMVKYTAKDKAGFETVVIKTFRVIADDRPVISPIFENFWNGWTITLVAIAGVCLVGIVVLLCVKPKKKVK